MGINVFLLYLVILLIFLIRYIKERAKTEKLMKSAGNQIQNLHSI